MANPYQPLADLRKAIIQEFKKELGGNSFTLEHYRIVELRVQTALTLKNASGDPVVTVQNVKDTV